MAALATTRRVITQLQQVLADLDPQRVTSAQAVCLVEAFVEIERLAVAGKTLLADRAACSKRWAEKGHDSADSWLAELTKTSLGEAKSTLEASRALYELPGTTEALKDGRLSGAQLDVVARSARKDPASEAELLEVAQRKSFKHLRDRARQLRAQAHSKEEEDARYMRLIKQRYCRAWTDDDGALCLGVRLVPDAGGRVLASLTAEADAIFKEARAAGLRDHPDHYRADALVALITGTARTGRGARDPKGAKAGARTDVVVVRADAAALRRGYVKGAETCEILGVGPCPVSTVLRILPTAFAKTAVSEGVEVKNVSHPGRCFGAHQTTALELRDPTCVWPGCSVAHGLEAHHFRQDFAVSGTTSLDELARLCAHHHDLVTYGGYLLEGGPGNWSYRAPPAPAILEPQYHDTG